MSDDERHPVYVNELEMAVLAVGLELIKSHNLFPNHEATQQDLLGRLYGLMVL